MDNYLNISSKKHNEANEENDIDVVNEVNEKEAMLNSIKERNKVINEYIANLNEKLVKHKVNGNHIKDDDCNNNNNNDLNDDEEDEFVKAEAQYKQSHKQLESNEPTFKQLKKEYNSLVFHSKNNFTFIRSPNALLNKNPEMIYIRENNHLKKQQSLRRLRLQIYDVLPSLKVKDKQIAKIKQGKDNGKDIDRDKGNYFDSFLVHNHSNNLSIPLTCSMSLSLKEKKNLSPKAYLLEKEKKALKCLHDPRNPYSQNWSNQILKTKFMSKIGVKGFLGGIPQLRLKKLKERKLPNPNEIKNYNVEYVHMVNGDHSGEGNQESVLSNSNIEYPFILKHF